MRRGAPVATCLSEHEIARLLEDYQVVLPPPPLTQLACYLDLLLRWNRRVNLTGYRDPRQIVRRLFGESLYLTRVVDLRGWLVDVGSGAGFPGLALKLAAPGLRVTLIESRRKKGAFLKEVVRSCSFSYVDVVVDRFESWGRRLVTAEKPTLITTRAVKVEGRFLDLMRAVLPEQGKGAFLTTAARAAEIRKSSSGWDWSAEFPIPQRADGIVLVGSKISTLAVSDIE